MLRTMHYIELDLATWPLWPADLIWRFEDYLSKWAKFTEVHGA